MQEETIVAMRESGLTCREVARQLEIPEHRVWYVMRKTGYSGVIRHRGQKVPIPSMKELIDSFDYFGIEATVRGTYICTIGDVSGNERGRVKNAIRDAYRKLLKEETKDTKHL
mgnify:CR=1 FL=1